MRASALLLPLALASCGEREKDPKPFTLGSATGSAGPAVLTPEGHATGARTGAAPGPAVGVPSPNDPINLGELTYLRSRAQAVLQRLVGALEPKQKSQVQGIPLGHESKPGEVNAFAGCTAKRRAVMVITDDLMRLQAGLARAEATDEIFKTQKRAAYLELVAKTRGRGRAIPTLPAGFYAPAQDADPRKVARQRVLYDEALAFVLGHELAHHYLGHTGCVAGVDGVMLEAAELSHVLSQAAPAFNQPNEIAADVYGTNDALAAGFGERGALLTLESFLALRGPGAAAGGFRFSFEDTHPDPKLRIPVVTETAAAWRATGGKGLLTLPFLK